MSQTQIPDFGTTTRIRRPQLINSLVNLIQSGNRYISIRAGCGYGKTMLLADVAQTIDVPAVWLQCTPAEQNPAQFLARCKESVAEYDTSLIIILDDFHEAANNETLKIIADLPHHLPPQSTIFIATETPIDVQADLALTEVDLRFTTGEIQQLFRKRFGVGIDAAQTEEILRVSGGVPARVLLEGHLLHSQPKQIGTDKAGIFKYLAWDLAQHPPELQRFLLHTSVLPELSIDTCNQLLDIDNSEEIFARLARIYPIATQDGLFFYPPIFRDFLQSTLTKNETEYRQTASRAGDILSGHSQFTSHAIYLYLSAHNWDEAAELLRQRRHFFVDPSYASQLEGQLSIIPHNKLAEHPYFLLLRGRILNDHIGHYDEAMRLFEHAIENFGTVRIRA